MKRRTYLTSMLGGALAGAHLAGQTRGSSIALHVDLEVDPAKEKKMLEIFHGPFHAAAIKQPGFIDVQMYKLRSALQGSAPTGANYRFVLKYQTEEQRKAWVATAIHKKLWPQIEATLVSKQYTVLLYDLA